ncbi:hypothetical protein PQ465_00690 [Sphingobacterium oryzagri]|uniref:HTH cro/C1-type domain-containing protein n=1 Tax=Sphingobacterium oryzagri TaxID=3025669 RepID=A0ABY7WIV7_9SPHI|nr:hypothetical protein [Sphingobacterium sp. KACC 22765]WDF68910.1 hypothetical protein PQ465_00690 [Sphingobacterium sp. KACC 22765]
MTIKERVVHIATHKGLGKVSFFSALGLSYANFKGPQKLSALSAETLVRILRQYPEISPVWLLMGEGAMLREEQQLNEQSVALAAEETQQHLIQAQDKTIRSLERQIEFLEREIQFLRQP